MATVSFYLKDSVIYASVSQGSSQRYRISTYQKVDEKHWNKKKNRVKDSYENSTSINETLSKVETLIEKLAISKEYLYSANDIRNELNEKLFKHKLQNNQNSQKITTIHYINSTTAKDSFITFLENYIKTNPRNNVGGTLPALKTTLFNVKSFCKFHSKTTNKYDLYFSDINKKFEQEFSQFILKEKGLRINSYYTYMALIVSVMKHATDLGVNTDLSYVTFRHKPLQADKFGLTEEEIERIWNVKTNYKTREHSKMIFVFESLTSLRYPSDLTRLDIDKHLVYNKKLDRYFVELPPQKQLNTSKNNKKTYIPLNDRALQIFRTVKRFKKIEHHNHVNNVRRLAEDAELVDIITYIDNEKGVQVIKEGRKCDLITPHAARHSFISNARKNNIPSELLSSITQLSEATIKKYYDHSTSEDAAKIIIEKGLM